MDKKELVENLLAVKEASGKTYDEIAEALDLCNIYVAQLFRAQAQLKKETAPKLAKLIPGITKDLLKEMQKCPMRSFDPSVLQEPHIFRMTEVCAHYGESILSVINEKFGDGIMSSRCLAHRLRQKYSCSYQVRPCILFLQLIIQ